MTQMLVTRMAEVTGGIPLIMRAPEPTPELSPSGIKARYEGSADRPLGSFVGLFSVYTGLVAGGAVALRRRGVRLPERIPTADLALATVATYKVSRLVAKDPISSPFRAPFTRFEGQAGEAEVDEEVVGTGPRHAVGELVTCPFCVEVWVGTAFMFGYLASPRLARTVASAVAMVAGADVLQFGYDALQKTS